MRRFPIRLLACVLTFTLVAKATAAPPLADRVPDDAMLYVGWSGTQSIATKAAYQQSHLKSLLDASNMRAVATELVPNLLAKITEKGGADAKEAVDVIRMVGGTLWQYPSAAYFTVNTDGQFPMPRAAIFARVGEDAEAIQKRLDELLAKAPAPPQVPVLTFVVDGIVGISVGYDEGPMAVTPGVDGRPNALALSEDFNDALKQVADDPEWIVYYNNELMLRLVDLGVQFGGQPQVQDRWPRVKEALGIDGVRRIIITGAFDGKNWGDRAFVDAPAPRRGLLAAFEGTPVPQDLLRMAPAGATSVAVAGIDFPKVIDNLRTVLGEAEPEAQTMFNQAFGAAQMYTAVNLETDLFASLGEHWLLYNDPAIAGNGFAGAVVVNKLRDPAKAERAINAVVIAINNTLAGVMKKQDVQVSIRSVTSDDIKVSYVAVPFVAPSWTIRDGYLYAGLFPQTTLTAAKRGVPEKSIEQNAAFADVQKKLAVKDAITIYFSDLPRTMQNDYQLTLVMARGMLGLADMFRVNAPELVIPPLDVLSRHLEPSGAASWTDERGFHFRNVSPFPGSALMGGPGMVAMAVPGMMAGAVAEAAQQSQQRQARQRCAINMQSLGVRIQMYAQAHDGNFPPDLGSIAMEEDPGEPQEFVCSERGKPIPPDWHELAPEQRAEWVNTNSDYVYLGADLRTDANDPVVRRLRANVEDPVVVLHERPHNHGREGMHLLMSDGSVQFHSPARADQLINKPR